MHVWARTTWLKQKDILFVYSDPLPSLPPPMPYQHLIFSLGPANINLISKTSVLKIYCTTQNSIKSSRRLSPRSPTNLRALDYDGSTYTAKWFTSLVHSLVLVPLSAILHMHHFVPGLSGGNQVLPSEEEPKRSSEDGLPEGWQSRDGAMAALAPPALHHPS